MKYKVGDLLVFKTNRRDNSVIPDVDFGVVSLIEVLTDVEGIRSYYVVKGCRVKESEVLSKILTEENKG